MKIQAAVTHAQGAPFSIEAVNLSGPGANEVLVRVVATGVCHTDAVGRDLAVSPYPVVLGHEGAGVIEKVGANVTGVAVGDHVVGMGGWQQYSVVDGNQIGMMRKVDTTHVPLSAYLGAVGMPGVTAWYGLVKLCMPKAGETIVVSAASGAVGSAVGQLAKLRGCRVVGVAGGADKCAYVVDELGFDACIDYKAHRDAKSLDAALAEAAPKGIDGNFENVGGVILDAILRHMNPFGRIALCGMISGYDGVPIPLSDPSLILKMRLRVEGFIVSEHMEVWPEALTELGTLVATKKLKYRESIAPRIEEAPEAFIGLLKGKNFGKQLVRLS